MTSPEEGLELQISQAIRQGTWDAIFQLSGMQPRDLRVEFLVFLPMRLVINGNRLLCGMSCARL